MASLRTWLLPAFGLLLLGMASWAHAENPQIRDVMINVDSEKVLVYAKVTNCFTKEMDAAILAGVPTTFTFYLNLYQERTFWWDEKLSAITVRHTVKYDGIKKQFYLSVDDRPQAHFQDFESAKIAMAELNGIFLAQMRDLKKERPAYVTIKAKLDKVRLPMYLEYVLFFVSLWDFETDWHRKAVLF